MVSPPDLRANGPGRYFAEHPAAYRLALAGSAGTAAYAAVRAIRATGTQRVAWTALALLEAGIAAGIVNVRSRNRP
jgi:hypothetical protein